MNTLFTSALNTWQRCDTLRRNRQRFKRYTYGDQWADIIDDGHGNMLPERQIIKLTGARPLTNNLIRRIVKTIVGRYRTMAAEEHLYNADPRSPHSINRLEELDARLLEEFLISGCAIQRVSLHSSRIPGAPSHGTPRVDNIAPSRFFIDSINDTRGWDTRLVGVLHDMPMADIVDRFCASDPEKALAIRRLFQRIAADPSCFAIDSADIGAPVDTHASADFFTSPVPGKYRIIEVWSLDADEQLLCHDPADGSLTAGSTADFDAITLDNRRRAREGKPQREIAVDTRLTWRCRWFAPDGTLLASELSPMRSGALPFAFKFYPLTDGEVHPFVEDLIGQQKYINRLITLIDRMIGSSAKGVLLFPVNQKPDSISWQDIQDNWSACGGLIPIMGNNDVLPQQINNSFADGASASSLLSLELKLFEEISGVTGALMGRDASATTGSGLYEAQVRNATISLADTFRTFLSFTANRNALINDLR